MFCRLMLALALLSCVAGCGGTAETQVTAPPEVVSENVDADRAKEAGAPAPNVDYTKQN